MSLPVPKGNKQLTDEDLALLATSPTWAQSPSEWFNRSGNDEETQAIQKEPGWRGERDEDPRGFLDDLDGTCRFSPLSPAKHTDTQCLFLGLRQVVR